MGETSLLGKRQPGTRFALPPEGALLSNGPDDPLPFYYRRFSGLLYRRRIELALSLLAPPYESVLELGYGSGVLIPTLVSIGRRVYGLDRESDPAQVQRRLTQLGTQATLMRGDARRLPFSDQRFDLVVAISIFEHIADLEPVIQETARVLKPGGSLLVGMPRVDRLMERLFPLIGYDNIREQHVSTYQQFLAVADRRFDVVRITSMPARIPTFAGLYFVMLLKNHATDGHRH